MIISVIRCPEEFAIRHVNLQRLGLRNLQEVVATGVTEADCGVLGVGRRLQEIVATVVKQAYCLTLAGSLILGPVYPVVMSFVL